MCWHIDNNSDNRGIGGHQANAKYSGRTLWTNAVAMLDALLCTQVDQRLLECCGPRALEDG